MRVRSGTSDGVDREELVGWVAAEIKEKKGHLIWIWIGTISIRDKRSGGAQGFDGWDMLGLGLVA